MIVDRFSLSVRAAAFTGVDRLDLALTFGSVRKPVRSVRCVDGEFDFRSDVDSSYSLRGRRPRGLGVDVIAFKVLSV